MIHNQDCSSITQTYFKRTARLEVKEKIQVTLSQCTQTGIQQDAGPIRGGGSGGSLGPGLYLKKGAKGPQNNMAI